MSKLVALPARPSRLSPKLRRAIDLRVRRMLPISEACEQAGLSTAGWYKAMQRRAVQDHLEEVQRKFIAEAGTLKATAKTRDPGGDRASGGHQERDHQGPADRVPCG